MILWYWNKYSIILYKKTKHYCTSKYLLITRLLRNKKITRLKVQKRFPFMKMISYSILITYFRIIIK